MTQNLRTLGVVMGLVLIAGSIQHWPSWGLVLALLLAGGLPLIAMAWDVWHPQAEPPAVPAPAPEDSAYWRRPL